MIKRILCPVDFSDASCAAAEYAMNELAPQLGAEIVWTTVLETSDIRVALDAGLYGFESDEDLHRKVEEWIEQQFARIDHGGSVPTKRDIRRGMPEREIVESIQEHAPQLIVMGSNGIAKRIPVGSKTEHVLRHTDVPVVVLKAR
jgi:nucleotide-binding universal stress UspA family protein